MTRFIGRKEELARLKQLTKKKVASFVVIRGRRRIGKSRLIQEFGKSIKGCHILSGIPPGSGTTRQKQLEHFAEEVATSFNIPPFSPRSWSEAFRYLGQLCAEGRIVLALDEISWIGSKDSEFLGYLKNAWDRYFSKNSKLILIVCGSVSSWIEKNILSSTGFVGRISLDMKLEELPLADAVKFWDHCTSSPYEILKVLSVTGAVPRYLEEVTPQYTADETIRQLCFESGGLLYREFDQIFSDLFSKKGPLYAKILELLADGPHSFDEVVKHIEAVRGGTVSNYLKDLAEAGFICEDYTWNLKTLRISNLRKYRLSDNYMRFYLKYVAPSKKQIADGRFKYTSPTSWPGWDSMMGLQFENLVLNNVLPLFAEIGVDPSDVLQYGPFFQRGTGRQKGCQVDLLIQTKRQSLFICEIKFSPQKIGQGVVTQMVEKRSRMSVPRHWATRLVLIHVNGVTERVEEDPSLHHTVDFGELIDI